MATSLEAAMAESMDRYWDRYREQQTSALIGLLGPVTASEAITFSDKYGLSTALFYVREENRRTSKKSRIYR